MVRFHPPAPPPPRPNPTLEPGATLAEPCRRLLDDEDAARGELWLVAFSGGPDSTALAAALARPAAERGLALLLVHVDHRLDPGSAGRAERARALALRLALPFETLEVDVPRLRRRGESPEAGARRLRYAALEERLLELGATRLLTAHHRDDQIETILLQLLRGAPLERLGGMPRGRGAIRRPLLDLPRAALLAFLERNRLEAIDDPTNLDLRTPRNRVRHRLLPRLRAADPRIDEALLALAARSARLRDQLDRQFEQRLEEALLERTDRERQRGGKAFIEGKNENGPEAPRVARAGSFAIGDGMDAAGTTLPASFLTALPEPLRLPALRWLLERLGTERLSSSPSMKAFLSSLLAKNGACARLEGESGRAPRAAAATLRLPGGGRLTARRGRLEWRPRESRTPDFSYTLQMPGEVELPELGFRLRIRRARVEPWMFRGDRWRVGFEACADHATVRSRRPGDRMRPLGSPGSRKLKAILIDRGIPAEARSRLPLLEIERELAWVPGVALGDRFALRGGDEAWLAELEALDNGATSASSAERKAR